jgi:hypothetical protein
VRVRRVSKLHALNDIRDIHNSRMSYPGMFASDPGLRFACKALLQSSFGKGSRMSITIDRSAIADAKARVHTWNGRHAVAHRGEADPAVVERCGSELATAVIARSIITQLEKRPNLTLSQRVELIALLIPSDRTTADRIISQLRDHADIALLAYGGGHGST